jgi:hypothetical protein
VWIIMMKKYAIPGVGEDSPGFCAGILRRRLRMTV